VPAVNPRRPLGLAIPYHPANRSPPYREARGGGVVIGLAPEQHDPQREEGRGDPEDHDGLPFKDGERLFHNAITERGSSGSGTKKSAITKTPP
jgi:hypothetical protein